MHLIKYSFETDLKLIIQTISEDLRDLFLDVVCEKCGPLQETIVIFEYWHNILHALLHGKKIKKH